MKVKIGDLESSETFDSEEVAIVLELDAKEREQIASMGYHTKYARFPSNDPHIWTVKNRLEFMKEI